MANVNYSVVSADMLIAGGETETNTSSEFQLLDQDGTVLQTVSGTGMPPVNGLFLDVDDTKNYSWQVRQQAETLGWSDWSTPCQIVNVETP